MKKNCLEEAVEDLSWSHFFRIREFKNFFEVAVQIFVIMYMISLVYRISHCLSANHNPELECVICTGVTLCTLLSANQNRVEYY